MHPIQLIAADFDGTLLSPDGSISPRNLAAIRAAQQAGIVFAAATGRYAENASQMMVDAGIDCPVISTNGAVVEKRPFGERILDITLDGQAARRVFERLEQTGEGYYIFGRGSVCTRRADGRRHISEADAAHFALLQQRVKYEYGLEACLAALTRPIHKFFAFFSDPDRGDAVSQAFFDIPGIEVTRSGRSNLEIMSDKANKGIGLSALARALGIGREAVMALGDQHNDLPMLRFAGLGIAMGNAEEDIKRQADAVTATNAEDGVAEAIQRYCLDPLAVPRI